jgi:predicted nucleic acid-binding Zn ribbon protein
MNSIPSILPRVLAEMLGRGPMSQGKLEVAWRVAVGEALSRVTTVRLQAGGVVDVRSADTRWHHELRRSSPLILDRLKSLVGADQIARLHIVTK